MPSQAHFARKDDGTRRLSYSRLSSFLAVAFISREWQPHSTADLQSAGMSFATVMGSEAGFHVAREFLPKFFGRRNETRRAIAPSLKMKAMRKFVLALILTSACAFGDDPAGVPNFHKVDDHLYRGAQPSAQGFRNLARLGVKNDHRSSRPRRQSMRRRAESCDRGRMKYIHLGLNGYRRSHVGSDCKTSGNDR